MSTASAPATSFESLLSSAVKRGRREAPLPFALGRELTAEDMLAASEEAATQTPSLKEMRASHHQLARLVAQGEKPAVISEITGYAASRVSVLKNDPGFQELVEHYKELEVETHTRSRVDFHERLAAIGFDSLEVLHQRVVDEPHTITNAELLRICETVADRTGYGKTSTVNSNNVTTTLSAEELRQIRADATQGQTVTLAPPDRESLLRIAVRATEPYTSDEEVSGSEGEGRGLREEGREDAQSSGPGAGEVSPVDTVSGREE